MSTVKKTTSSGVIKKESTKKKPDIKLVKYSATSTKKPTTVKKYTAKSTTAKKTTIKDKPKCPLCKHEI